MDDTKTSAIQSTIDLEHYNVQPANASTIGAASKRQLLSEWVWLRAALVLTYELMRLHVKPEHLHVLPVSQHHLTITLIKHQTVGHTQWATAAVGAGVNSAISCGQLVLGMV